MGTRIKVFELNDNWIHWHFGTYALIMFYAKQLDIAKGKKLMEATQSEYYYHVENNLPTDHLSDADKTVHFNVADLNEVIEFIELSLIPALNQETVDLIEKYGGQKNFCNQYDLEASYLNAIILYEEHFESDPESIAYDLERFRDLIKYALALNQPYEAYID
jgi:hypothetical protein